MSDFSNKIIKIAQSDMSRDALSHWPKFELPERNEKINALLEQLGDEPETELDACPLPRR